MMAAATMRCECGTQGKCHGWGINFGETVRGKV